MTDARQFSAAVLKIDAPAVSAQIEAQICGVVLHRLRRRGVVVGLSGGVDSSVVAALAGIVQVIVTLLSPLKDETTSIVAGVTVVTLVRLARLPPLSASTGVVLSTPM